MEKEAIRKQKQKQKKIDQAVKKVQKVTLRMCIVLVLNFDD